MTGEQRLLLFLLSGWVIGILTYAGRALYLSFKERKR